MTEYEKTSEDIKWVEIDTPDRGPQRCCSISDARLFFDNISGTQLQTVLNDYDVTRYKSGRGQTRYVCEIDLEEIKRERMKVRAANGTRVSPRHLLAEAAALLEQIKANHEDVEEVEAIVKWLEQYQKIKD